jgi:4,5-DOPA dioxygenase extradiol
MSSLTRRAFLSAGATLALSSQRGASASPALMPTLFVSHGPGVPIPTDRAAELRSWGAGLQKPRGILCMTPHFAARALGLGPTGRGVAWHSFPSSVARRLPPGLQYPSPPSEALARRTEHLLSEFESITRRAKPGLEHTTWLPLRELFPHADVPVLELTFPYRADARIFELGARLSQLRQEGILIVASGTMTHNLAAVDITNPNPDTPVLPWGRDFDAWVRDTLLAQDIDTLLDWRQKAPGAELAHPDDGAHFRVLFFALGCVLGNGGRAADLRFPIEGFEYGQPKRCVQIGSALLTLGGTDE